jgi:hypothetical protein
VRGDNKVSDTPQTDDLARGNHVVPTEWAQQLERERDEARELAEQMSESNQVLMADVKFYRQAWEQLKKEAK